MRDERPALSSAFAANTEPGIDVADIKTAAALRTNSVVGAHAAEGNNLGVAI